MAKVAALEGDGFNRAAADEEVTSFLDDQVISFLCLDNTSVVCRDKFSLARDR